MSGFVVEISPTDESGRYLWECGDWSGSIVIPDDLRGHGVRIAWDADSPEEWESLEEAIEKAACEAIAKERREG